MDTEPRFDGPPAPARLSRARDAALRAARAFQIEAASIDEVRALLHAVFPTSPKFSDDGSFLNWFYLGSPDGPAVWQNALVRNEVKAHYGSIPQKYHSAESEALLYLSVDSATDEALRGRGAFVALGEAVYAKQKSLRPDTAGAIGVPNRQAAPPRSKRLGWTLLETLPLTISIGVPAFRSSKAIWGPALELLPDASILTDEMLTPRQGWRQKWTRAKLIWRASNPLGTTWLHRLGDVVALVSVRRRAGFPVIAVIVKTFIAPGTGPVRLEPLVKHIRSAHGVTAVAHLGRNADIAFSGLDFPERWRPSPLILGARVFEDATFDLKNIDCFEAWDYDVF